MTNLVAQYGYLAVLVIVGLESTGVPLPGETTLVAAALYAGATHNLNIVGVVIAAAVGAILGDVHVGDERFVLDGRGPLRRL